MKYLIIVTLFISIFGSNAQTATFEWSSEFCRCPERCEFRGTFDSTIITRKQLENTRKYLTVGGYIEYNVTPNLIEEVKHLNTLQLKLECLSRIDELENNEFIDSPFWEMQREKKLNRYREFCKLKEVTLQAYSNPSILKTFEPAQMSCQEYINSLINGGDELLNTWKELVGEQASRNVAPENLWRTFDSQISSEQKHEFAKFYVMKYGWWNCANRSIAGTVEPMVIEEEFQLIFESVSSECQ